MPKARIRLVRNLTILFALVVVALSAVGQTVYEAENATLSGPTVASQYSGYSGTGYADYQDATGDYVEFLLNAASAGTYPVAFRYANGGASDRPLQLTVNGSVVINSLSFPATGGWSLWAFTSTNNVALNAGVNTVRLTATGSSGGNLDYLLVAASGTGGLTAIATNALLRRPISPSQPMLLVHIDTWNYPDPRKIIDLIPQDIRPYVVMNLSLSISHNSTNSQWLICQYGYETAKSWIRACAEANVWCTVQPSSGGYSQLPDSDLGVFEEFYRNYPNFIGFNYAEQFWGFDSATDPLSWPWFTRVAHWVDLMKLNQKYGGFLIVSWCGNQYDPNINPIAMMKRNPAFAAVCKQSPKNFILEEKYTQQSYQSDMESVCLGTYLAGYCGQYGIRYDESGWTDATGNHTNFTMASAGAPILEHGLLTGETVIDGPELIWAECIQGLSNGTTPDGYTTRRWGLFPQYQNNILDMFRKILDGTVRLPSRQEVINRTKVVIIDDVNSGSADNIYSSPQTLFEGLYRLDGDGDYQSNKNFMKKTGRYPTVPTVYQLADSTASNLFTVKVNNSAYATRWPTIAAKTNELNTLFPPEYTGDIFAGRNENGWILYNPYKTGLTNGQMASGSIPFKYNTCDHMDLTLAQYTAGIIKEFSNSLSIYLNNYDNFINLGMRTDTIAIYGSSVQPVYAWADRANHSASTVTSIWSGGVFTLNVTHNGPLDLTVNCAGTGTGRLTNYTLSAISPPAAPLIYTGPNQYEAENFDYKNIGGNTTEGVGTGISNYTAMGYLNFGTSAAASIRDTVTVLETGTYRLQTKYAVIGTSLNTIDVFVNGVKVATPSFTPVAALGNWATNEQWITLNGGSNTLEFRANAAGASPIYFDNIVVVPTAYDTGVCLQENSKGFVGVDGTIGNTVPGFTGTGYANASNSYGAGIDWNIYFDSSVTKALTFRYAGTNDGLADLLVNGVNVASRIQFPSTGTLTNWDYVTVYPYIAAGIADVRLQSSTNVGLPYIDAVAVTGGGAETTLAVPALDPIADTYVRDGVFAGCNFGAETKLDINGSASSGSTRAAYLKFNVRTLTNAQSVVLRLTPESATGNPTLTYGLAANDSWSETGTSWNNQPGGAGAVLTNLSGYTIGQPARIDMTGVARSQAAGDGILSLQITEPNAQDQPVSFASRENWVASARPALEYQMAQPPAAPTNLVATSGYSDRANLSWTAASGAIAYNLKRASHAGGPYWVIARNVTGASYVDASLSSLTPYFYIVTAVNNIGESDPSAEVAVTTSASPQTEPLADSYVESSTAGSNWGASTNLLVKNNVAVAVRNAYLMFDVHGLAGVSSATLTLMPNRADDSTVKIYYGLAATNWTEAGITWNNQPGGLGSNFATNTVAAGVADMVDVTSVVKSQASNGGLLSIEITQPTNSNNGLIQFCSREHPTNSWHPVLQYSFPPNSAPTLAAIPNQSLSPGAILIITNAATDPDVPAQTMTYRLLAAPNNASLNPASGVLTWRPQVNQASTTNPFTLTVADSGTPTLSATQSFFVTVRPVTLPQISRVTATGGQLVLQVSGDSGLDYEVQNSTDLANWRAVFLTNAPALPFPWTNGLIAGPSNSFFRIVTGPPLP